MCTTSGFICPLFLWGPHVALKVAMWTALSDWTSLVWMVRAHACGSFIQLEEHPCLWALLNYWICSPKIGQRMGLILCVGHVLESENQTKHWWKNWKNLKLVLFCSFFFSFILSLFFFSFCLSLSLLVYSLMLFFHFTRPHKSRRVQQEMVCFIH